MTERHDGAMGCVAGGRDGVEDVSPASICLELLHVHLTNISKIRADLATAYQLCHFARNYFN